MKRRAASLSNTFGKYYGDSHHNQMPLCGKDPAQRDMAALTKTVGLLMKVLCLFCFVSLVSSTIPATQ